MKRASARAWLALVVTSGSLICGLTGACASILDIKDLPIASADAAIVTSEASTLDATAGACAPRGTTFCQVVCPVPDFCDDFEGPRLAEGWDPPFGTQNPLLSGGGNVSLVRDDGGNQSQVLLAEAKSTTTDSDTSVIATTLDRVRRDRKLRGVRISVNARLTRFDMASDAGGGSLSFLAFGSQALNLGVGILLYDEPPNAVRLVLQQRALGGNGNKIDLADIITVPRVTLLINPLPLELIVARPSLLRDQQIGCNIAADAGEDAGGENDMRVLLRAGTGVFTSKCAAFRDDLATADWLNATALFVGASVSDFGAASIRLDNLAITLFE